MHVKKHVACLKMKVMTNEKNVKGLTFAFNINFIKFFQMDQTIVFLSPVQAGNFSLSSLRRPCKCLRTSFLNKFYLSALFKYST